MPKRKYATKRYYDVTVSFEFVVEAGTIPDDQPPEEVEKRAWQVLDTLSYQLEQSGLCYKASGSVNEIAPRPNYYES